MISKIISSYKRVQAQVSGTSSGRNKFNLILSFVTDCEKTFNSLPPFALFKDFLFILIEIILKGDINFIDPAKLTAVKQVLNESRKEFSNTKGGDIILAQIDKAVDIVNMQLLKVYFYIGKYEDGLSILNAMLREKEEYYNAPQKPEAANTKETKQRSTFSVRGKIKQAEQASRYALVNPEIYKESKAYEILSEMKAEFDRLNSFSEDHINILLVEHEGSFTGFSTGIVQNLYCETEKQRNGEKSVVLDNITDYEDSELESTLEEIHRAADSCIKSITGKRVHGNIRRNLQFENVKGVYKGASLGLGSAVISVCNYFDYSNRRMRCKVNNAAAFTGAIDKEGNVLSISGASIKDKIEAAFFSWIKYCIVPKENLNDAVDACNALRAEYPTKEMFITGAESIQEIFKNTEIIKCEKQKFRNYSASVYERNKTLSLVSIFLIMAVLIGYGSMSLVKRGPKAFPQTNSEMVLVYSPESESKWTFTNGNNLGSDTINFGEVAVGDQWLPELELWNNGYDNESFDVRIEGSDDFEILWFEEEGQPSAPENISPLFKQRLYIKYAPLSPSKNTTAKVIFTPRHNKEFIKTIYLKASSNPYKGGYSAKIKDGNDRILISPGRNLLTGKFTVSFWIKPDAELLKNNDNESYTTNTGYPILRFSNENPSLNKFRLILRRDSTINVRFSNRKTDFKNAVDLISSSKVNFGDWNYVCISYDLSDVYLTLNNSTSKKPLDKDIIRQINDLIIFGNHHPTFDKNRDYDTLSGSYKLFNFKVYEKFVSPEELKNFKYDSPKWDDEGILLNYEFDQMNDKKVFDLSKTDMWAVVSGCISRSLDIPETFIKKEPFEKVKGNAVLFREEEGRMEFYRNLFRESGSFSIQMDVLYKRLNEKREEFFTILNPEKEYWLSISKDSLFMYYGKYKMKQKFQKNIYLPYIAKWSRYTLAHEKGKTNIYLDSSLILQLEIPENSFDIGKMNYGMIFGCIAYIAAARHYGMPVYFDNVRIFSRAIGKEEIFSGTKDGLEAEWAFDNIRGFYAYDNVKGYPALLKGKIKPVAFEN